MKEKILVVDDEQSIREALSKLLQTEDYTVLLAQTGKEAIERFGTEAVDLLVLDLNLPGGNGWATLGWLAKVNPLLPVIIITGRANQSQVAEKSGADALMEKPLDVPKLLQTIRELLDEPMESRAQRASNRSSGFRFVSCDEHLLAQKLTERFTVPFPLPQTGWHLAHKE